MRRHGRAAWTPPCSTGTEYSTRSFFDGARHGDGHEIRISRRRLAEIRRRHAPRIVVGDVAGLAQQQRQRADRGGQRDPLAVGDLDLERDRLDDRRLVGLLVGKLIDRQHLRVLDHDIGGGGVLLALARQHHVDMVAGQHEAGDALDVVDANRHRRHAGIEHGGQRGALPRPGDLRGQHGFVGLHRHEHHALTRREIGDRAECAGRQRVGRPRQFAQRRRRQLIAEAQRPAGDHDGALRRRRFVLRFETLHARGFLVAEPGLRQKNSEQSEQDRKADHDEGAGTQLLSPDDALKPSNGIRESEFRRCSRGLLVVCWYGIGEVT